MLDFCFWRQNYGSSQQLNADTNGNGIVDAGDYVLLRKAATQQTAVISSGLVSAVPEPSAMMLAFTAMYIGFLAVDGRSCVSCI
jgi:hypothetical protein